MEISLIIPQKVLYTKRPPFEPLLLTETQLSTTPESLKDDDDDDDDGKEKVVAVLLESKNRRDVSSVRRLFEKREIVFWKRETRRVVGVFDEDVVAGIGKGGG